MWSDSWAFVKQRSAVHEKDGIAKLSLTMLSTLLWIGLSGYLQSSNRKQVTTGRMGRSFGLEVGPMGLLLVFYPEIMALLLLLSVQKQILWFCVVPTKSSQSACGLQCWALYVGSSKVCDRDGLYVFCICYFKWFPLRDEGVFISYFILGRGTSFSFVVSVPGIIFFAILLNNPVPMCTLIVTVPVL